MNTNNQIDNVTEMIFTRYLANHQVVYLESDESFRVQSAIQSAAKRLKDERKQNVFVYMHDRFCGFYEGTPPMEIPNDKTNLGPTAIQLMVLDKNEIARTNPQVKSLPFDPEANIIFILKDWEHELNNNLLTAQGIRNVVQSNMASESVQI